MEAGATPQPTMGTGGSPDVAGGSARPLSTGPARLTPLRELQLLEAYRAGQPEAIGELLQAYQRRVYGLCYRMLRDPEQARDLTQESMVKIIEGLSSYDGRAKLSTWIVRVSMNCCLSHLRKHRLRKHASLDHAGDPGDAGTGGGQPVASRGRAAAELSPAGRVEQAEVHAALVRALDRLEPDMKAVLVLRDMQDLDYQQISEVVDVPIGTVKSRIFRARAALRSALEAEQQRG